MRKEYLIAWPRRNCLAQCCKRLMRWYERICMVDAAGEGSLGVNPLTVFSPNSSACVQHQLTRQLGNHGVDASKSLHISFFLTPAWRGLRYVCAYGYSAMSRGGQTSVMSWADGGSIWACPSSAFWWSGGTSSSWLHVMLPFIFCVRLIDPVGFWMPPLLTCAAKCNVHKHSRRGMQHAAFTSKLNHTPQFWFYKEQRAIPNPTELQMQSSLY